MITEQPRPPDAPENLAEVQSKNLALKVAECQIGWLSCSRTVSSVAVEVTVAFLRRYGRCVAVLRFDPFTDIDAITKSLLATETGSNRSPRFMPMDLYKIDDHYVLHADLPGVDPGSVDVQVDGSTLTLTAHRSALSEDGVTWLASERFTGTYRRQLSISEDIDSERIVASYDNGVLTVSLPIAEKAKPRRIEIASGPPSSTANSEAETQGQIEA